MLLPKRFSLRSPRSCTFAIENGANGSIGKVSNAALSLVNGELRLFGGGGVENAKAALSTHKTGHARNCYNTKTGASDALDDAHAQCGL